MVFHRYSTLLFVYLWPENVQAGWNLVYEEDFSTPLQYQDAEWVRETYEEPFDTVLDDAGDWYKNDFGPAFTDTLSGFHTYRKEFTIGQDNWLTVSMSARDTNRDGMIIPSPNVTTETLGGRHALTINTPHHTSGVLLRPTRALPESYRIEYKLTNLDFGGKRNGNIVFEDGRINGYGADICKTQHPWGEGSRSPGWSGDVSDHYCLWQDIKEGPLACNGFNFLSIVDISDPSPRNNHFWNTHIKASIDTTSQHPDRVGGGSGGEICDADAMQFYEYRDSESFLALNMKIASLPESWTPDPGGLVENAQYYMNSCNGGRASKDYQAAGELLEPTQFDTNEAYTFAIERNSTGYTLEASGNFARVGNHVYRFFHPFVQDTTPIWHYNVVPGEYDGRYNADLRQVEWDFGSQTWYDQWPAGSAYPDYFVIGDLFTNYYEGSASLTDIRFFEMSLDEDEPACEPAVFLETNDVIKGGDGIERGGYVLYQHTNGNLQVWMGSLDAREVIVWESGVSEVVEGATYHTKLQGDSNLITWRTHADNSVSPVWQSMTVNTDGMYTFGSTCPPDSKAVALYEGRPQAGEQTIWLDVYDQSPTNAGNYTQLCDPVVFLEAGSMVYGGEHVVKGNYMLQQLGNGNLELREGTQLRPGRLLWESGKQETTIDTYYTQLQADGNLITWRVSGYGESVVWKTGMPQTQGLYLLVLNQCDEGTLAVLGIDGKVLWVEDLVVALHTTSPTTAPDDRGGPAVGVDDPHSGAVQRVYSFSLLAMFLHVLW